MNFVCSNWEMGVRTWMELNLNNIKKRERMEIKTYSVRSKQKN